MKYAPLLYGFIGLIAGVTLTAGLAFAAVNQANVSRQAATEKAADGTETTTNGQGQMSMADMSEQLADKRGDEFDKAFIEMMIAHHRGAIEMARLAETNARHEQLKALSRDIVTAQTKEINEMIQWQQQWGYSAGSSMNH